MVSVQTRPFTSQKITFTWRDLRFQPDPNRHQGLRHRVFVNRLSLEHSHTHLLTYNLSTQISHYNSSMESCQQRPSGSQSLKFLLLAVPRRKNSQPRNSRVSSVSCQLGHLEKLLNSLHHKLIAYNMEIIVVLLS